MNFTSTACSSSIRSSPRLQCSLILFTSRWPYPGPSALFLFTQLRLAARSTCTRAHTSLLPQLSTNIENYRAQTTRLYHRNTLQRSSHCYHNPRVHNQNSSQSKALVMIWLSVTLSSLTSYLRTSSKAVAWKKIKIGDISYFRFENSYFSFCLGCWLIIYWLASVSMLFMSTFMPFIIPCNTYRSYVTICLHPFIIPALFCFFSLWFHDGFKDICGLLVIYSGSRVT